MANEYKRCGHDPKFETVILQHGGYNDGLAGLPQKGSTAAYLDGYRKGRAARERPART